MTTVVPVVSIVIPAKDHLDELHRALGRLLASSTDTRVEIIVVDDGSQPALQLDADVVPHPARVRLVRMEHAVGPGAARNVGAGYASGEYIVFLDADDLPDAAWIDTWLDAAEAGADFAFCGIRIQDEGTGTAVSVRAPSPMGGVFLDVTAIFLPGCYMVPRQLFCALGGFDPAVVYGEHHELGIRLATSLSVAEAAGRVRSHAGELITKHHDRSSERLKAYADAQARGAHYVIRKHSALFRRNRLAKAYFLSVAGVSSYRSGRRLASLRYLTWSFVIRPRPRALARIGMALVPAIGGRMWG